MSELKSSLIDLKALQLSYAFEHGVNLGARSITISEEISHETFLLVDAAFTEMEADSKAGITIKLNSVGGSVYDALGIVGRMRASKCKVIVEGYGAIMSAASIILAAGGKRRISEFAWFMSHESVYGAEGSHRDIKALVEQREREERQWEVAMEKFTKRDRKWWRKVHEAGDKHLSAEECLEIGVVDEII